ncbi:MAG TPA: type III secretion system export apparatus subunit SctU [Rhabdochlamydiaceae bacterium]|jgi:type III secretion YscU/HrpY family protein
MAEKTEQATPKKLRDARKKGQVAKSQDFPSAFTFIVSIATVLIAAGYLYENLGGFMVAMFKLISGNPDLQNRAGGLINQAITIIFNASLPIVLVTTLVGLLINFIIVGPMFSIEAMKPDIKRLNPVTNIKNLFKFKTLFELLKSIFKIAGALILIYSVVWYSLPEIISTAGLSVLGSAEIFVDFLIKVIIRVGIFFLAIAIFDLIFQKRTFSKEMMMEKFEVKQEFKDTEGDPHMKSKRRQTAQEIAYQEGVQSVKRAKAVITNPVHIAVALEYNAETEPAPRIVTMGKDLIADTIIRLAQEYGIPIMRNVNLAQTLFEKGKISEYVPEETYQAIAEILRWLEGIEKLETTGLELFK